MKKLLFLILPIILLSGCTKSSKVQKDIATYFPFYQNKIYVYNSNNSKTQKMFMMYAKDNKAQRNIAMEKLNMAQVFQNINGELKYSNLTVDNFHLENMLENGASEYFVELKEPFETGASWTITEHSDVKKQITNMNAKIETPYATFNNAMEVTAKFPDGITIKDYYVPNVGFVKSISTSNRNSKPFVLELSKIIDDATFDLQSKIYLMDEQQQNLITKDFDLKLTTNDTAYKKILEQMKNDKLVGEKAKIKKFEIDRSNSQDAIISVDFNSNFIDLTKLGAESEKLTLQAIVNTFGNIYGAKKVKLTVDGKNYESGHILMEDGEYFNVDA